MIVYYFQLTPFIVRSDFIFSVWSLSVNLIFFPALSLLVILTALAKSVFLFLPAFQQKRRLQPLSALVHSSTPVIKPQELVYILIRFSFLLGEITSKVIIYLFPLQPN
jgi:hypothetical protein